MQQSHLKDELFLKHDLNLFNFVIRLNQALREAGVNLDRVGKPDFSMLKETPLRLGNYSAPRLNGEERLRSCPFECLNKSLKQVVSLFSHGAEVGANRAVHISPLRCSETT